MAGTSPWRHRARVAEAFPDVKASLERVAADVEQTLDKIEQRERFVEAGIQTGFKQKRTDVVANKAGKPIILVECKAPSVKLSQTTFNQAFNYNQSVKAPFLWLTNGMQHLYWDCTNNVQCMSLPLAESI